MDLQTLHSGQTSSCYYSDCVFGQVNAHLDLSR